MNLHLWLDGFNWLKFKLSQGNSRCSDSNVCLYNSQIISWTYLHHTPWSSVSASNQSKKFQANGARFILKGRVNSWRSVNSLNGLLMALKFVMNKLWTMHDFWIVCLDEAIKLSNSVRLLQPLMLFEKFSTPLDTWCSPVTKNYAPHFTHLF